MGKKPKPNELLPEDAAVIKRRMNAWIDKLQKRGELAALDARDANQLLAELELMVEMLP